MVTVQQIITEGKVDPTIDTATLEAAKGVIQRQILSELFQSGLLVWTELVIRICEYGKLLEQINKILDSRPTHEDTTQPKLDYRILKPLGSTEVLLDRLDDDKSWQVVISCYAVAEFRYDEYALFESIGLAQEFIGSFSEVEARLFVERAIQGHIINKRSQPYVSSKNSSLPVG